MALLINQMQSLDKDETSDIFIFYAVCMDYLRNSDSDKYFYQMQGNNENYIFILIFYHIVHLFFYLWNY